MKLLSFMVNFIISTCYKVMIRAKFITVADLSILDRIVKINIYLLLARIYQGELPTLPGIYFTVFLRDFFHEISSKNSKTREER